MSIPNPYSSAGVVIPTTTTTTCVPTYVSITINAGNSFVLPPGATLVSVSDPTKIQSDCVDPFVLEQKQCYKFTVSGACNDFTGSEDQTENWEPENTFISAFYINSVKYSTTALLPFGASGQVCPVISDIVNSFESSLTQTSLNGVIEFVELDYNGGDNCDCQGLSGDRGWTVNIIFKTIPSIANNLEMELRTNTLLQNQPSPESTFIRVIPNSVQCPT